MDIKTLAIKVITTGTEKAEAELNKLGKSAGTAEKSTAGLSKISIPTSAVAAAAALSVAMVGLAASALKVSGQFEQQEIAFSTMFQSAEKGKRIMEDLAQFTKSTPFELPGVTDAAKKLAAFGFAQEELIPTLRRVGDVSAGLGVSLTELAEIYGKAKTQGTLYNEDINQLAGRGIPIFKELSKVMGVQENQIKKLASEGKVSFSELEQVFKNLTSEGGTFFNLMEKQADSLEGKMSNLNDTFTMTEKIMGDNMKESAKDSADELSRLVGEGGLFGDALIGLSIIINGIIEGFNSFLKLINDIYEAITTFNVEKSGLLNLASIIAKLSTGGISNPLSNMLSDMAKEASKAESEVRKLNAGIIELSKVDRSSLQAQDLNIYSVKGVVPKEPPSEDAIKRWISNQKLLNDTIVSGADEIDKVNYKYDQQVEKINAIKYAYKGNAEMQLQANAAIVSLESQRLEELEKVSEQLANWEDTLSSSLRDKFKSIFPVQQARAFGNILSDIAATSVSALVDGFNQMGQALSDGSVSGKEFNTILQNMAMQILKSLPTLFIQAGLMLIASNPTANLGIGLGLIAAGLSTSLVAGLAEGLQSEEKEEANAKGNIFSKGLMAFAKGGSFTNSIVDSPTHFKFANGVGLMGEAGPEAIIPLTRTADGSLGVRSTGGSKVEVNIINNSGEKVETKQSNEGGKLKLDVIVGNIISTGLSSGKYDTQLKQRYALSPRGV